LEDLLIRRRRVRAGWRVVLLGIHTAAAVGGLALWVWFLVSGPTGAAATSTHRHRAGYFPAHAATLHAMLAASTVTAVVITTVDMFRH
jgi:hypothetical protein